MMDFLLQPVPQAVIWTAVFVVLIVIGIYIVKRFRDQIDEDMPGPNEHISFSEKSTTKVTLRKQNSEQLRLCSVNNSKER